MNDRQNDKYERQTKRQTQTTNMNDRQNDKYERQTKRQIQTTNMNDRQNDKYERQTKVMENGVKSLSLHMGRGLYNGIWTHCNQ